MVHVPAVTTSYGRHFLFLVCPLRRDRRDESLKGCLARVSLGPDVHSLKEHTAKSLGRPSVGCRAGDRPNEVLVSLSKRKRMFGKQVDFGCAHTRESPFNKPGDSTANITKRAKLQRL